jgi:hypothetical protein
MPTDFVRRDDLPHWTRNSSFPIWAVMAMRLLLTLVALLTGLVVQLSPAQARVRAEGTSEIGALAAVTREDRVAASAPVPTIRPADSPGRESRCSAAMAADDADCLRPVILGVDRAHE